MELSYPTKIRRENHINDDRSHCRKYHKQKKNKPKMHGYSENKIISNSLLLIYLGESKVLQYFGNISHNLAAPYAFAKVVKVTNYGGLWNAWYSLCVDKLGSMAWTTALELIF